MKVNLYVMIKTINTLQLGSNKIGLRLEYYVLDGIMHKLHAISMFLNTLRPFRKRAKEVQQ